MQNGVVQKALESPLPAGYPGVAWHRRLYRSPMLLWRMGLGPLVGQVLMVVTHTGRRSGLPRRTVIEYHRLGGHIYAPCAYCPRADWYRNVRANPLVTIQTAGSPQAAIAERVTSSEELLAVFHLFLRRDPPLLKWYLRSLDVEPTEEDVLAKRERIYWLRFDPAEGSGPPPLTIDLVWIWPVLVLGALLLPLLGKRLKQAGVS